MNVLGNNNSSGSSINKNVVVVSHSNVNSSTAFTTNTSNTSNTSNTINTTNTTINVSGAATTSTATSAINSSHFNSNSRSAGINSKPGKEELLGNDNHHHGMSLMLGNVTTSEAGELGGRRQATRVFKKSSSNGKITVYLGKRDFVDHITHVDPIDGVVFIDSEYMKDRKVFGQVLAAFRYGREDLDVLGLTFRKNLFLAQEQIYPPNNISERPLTRLQERLIKKLGTNAYPFYFEVPPYCPASVSLQPAPGDTGKACGVDYELKAFVGEHIDDKPHKRNSVRLTIRKVMYAPSKAGEQPSIEVSKEFMMKPNKIHLEASLDKELYHHGETISVNVHVANNSNRTVKKIKVCVRQFADICLFSTAQYKSVVAELESEDGCQVLPGFTLSKVFELCPLLANNKDKWGLALDGQLKHEDTNLASSTLITNTAQRESLGIIVHYKVKVKLLISGPLLGGDLVAELPFTLMHPKPEEDDNLLLASASLIGEPRSSSRPSLIRETATTTTTTTGQLVMNLGGSGSGGGGGGDIVDSAGLIQLESASSSSGTLPAEVPTTNLIQLDDDDDAEDANADDSQDDDIIFEDFARLRLKGAETEA